MRKQIKKIIPYLLILIVLVGIAFFSPTEKVYAQGSADNTAEREAEKPLEPTPEEQKAEEQKKSEGGLGGNLPGCVGLDGFNMGGCLVNIFYFFLVAIPSWLLIISGMFFNAIVAIALSSAMYSSSASDFIRLAWSVVRDISNIFFILILLYISIKMILGLAGHGVKEMIAKVVVIALLINFSMFFTGIIIDASNMLALVFYNKLKVETSVNGTTTNYVPATNVAERDISGGLMKAFNPSKLLSNEFFEQAKERTDVVPPGMGTALMALTPVTAPFAVANILGYFIPQTEVPIPLMLGIELISGLIMLFAVYAFFVAGLSFLGRLIELWILIIFSPFAFMSFTIPLLSGTEYIGWDSWIKRLLKVSFMAPIFMFFMYFIFMLVRADLFGGLARASADGQTTVETILFVIIPALVILVLLLKATEFAKKGSGKLGEMIFTGAKMVGGLALGAATGGTSAILQGTMGAHYQGVANDDKLKATASGDKEHFARLGKTDARYNDVNFQKKMQEAAQRKLATANKYANKSFDIRDTGIGKFAESKTGMNFDRFGFIGMDKKGLKGGAHASQENAKEKAIEKEKMYQMSGAAAMEHDKSIEEQNIRATQYEKDKEDAKEWAKKHKTSFIEEDFREDYEHGKDLTGYGVEKKVAVGGIEHLKTSVEINVDRKNAYIISLKEKGVNPEIIAAVRKGENKEKKFLKMVKEITKDEDKGKEHGKESHGKEISNENTPHKTESDSHKSHNTPPANH